MRSFTSIKFILALIASLAILESYSAAPTVAASGLIFSNVQGDQMTLSWTNGNGASRIVIYREGSPVSAVPVDGREYSKYTSLSSGEVVMYKGSGNSFTFKNTEIANSLTINTTYHFAIFEYNGTGSSTEYLTSSFLIGNQTTSGISTEPTTNASSFTIQWKYEETIPEGTRQKMGIGWTNGNGTGRLVIFREGSAVDPSFLPVDGTNYNTWQNLGNGNIICYKGTGNYFEFKSNGTGNLSSNTTYYFAVIEYNGTGVTSNYKTGSYTTGAGTTLSTRPTTAPTNLTFTNVGTTSMTLNWTNGNGTNRLVIAKQGSAVTATPTDGVNYSIYQSISAGEVVVYNGTGNSFSFTSMGSGGLTLGTTYYFAVIEYSTGASGTNNYLSSNPLIGNQATSSYASEPAAPSSNLIFTNVQQTSMTLNWTNGDGAGRIVVVRTGSPVTVSPTDGVNYSLYQSLSSGQTVVYKGIGNTFNFTNNGNGALTSNTTYYFAIFEYNGSSSTINYLTSSSLTGNQITTGISSEPTVASTNLNFTNVLSSSMTVNWTNGDGTNRIVIYKKDSPVTVTPTDGVSYSLYQSLSSGQMVVYNGSGSSFNFTNDGFGPLTAGSTYYFAIFEYNGSGSGKNYFTGSYLTGSQTTSGGGAKIGLFDYFNDEEPGTQNLIVHPNPASEYVSCLFYTHDSENGIAYIYNASGQLIQQFEITNGAPTNIDLNNYEKGLYFVKVIAQKKEYAKKFVVY